MNRHNKALTIICAALSLALGADAAVAQDREVDTSGWACEFCPWPEGWDGYFDIGIGAVSEDDFKFADYRGLEDGPYLIGAASGIRSTATDYWRFDIDDIGLDSRSISVEGGQPGRYRIDLSYDELPKYLTDSARTPFSGARSGNLTLPGFWETAPRTDAMPALAEALQPVDLRFDRKTFGLGLSFTPPGRFEYDVSYERETREGVRSLAGGFLFTSTILPTPVDYVTDEIDASVAYLTDRWQARVAYYGSFFENERRSLSWENPFNPLVPGATGGQIDLAPDSELHMVSVGGNYALSDATSLLGSVSFGRMNQDDRFLPYTVNPNLSAAALPRQDLDGEVDVVDVSARLDTRLTSRLGMDVAYRFYERDAETPQDLFQPITMDLFVNPPRLNHPFNYQRQGIEVSADYRFASALRLSGGVEYKEIERSFGQRADTDEGEVWSRVRFNLGGGVDANLRLAYHERDGGLLEPRVDDPTGENPALRKFNYADRDREHAQLTVSAIPHEWVQITWSGSYSSDEYDDSAIGLTDSEFSDSTIDLTFAPKADVTAHAFYTWEDIDSTIANRQLPRGPDWFAETEDEIETAGIGIEFRNIRDRKFDLALDYVYSSSESRYAVNDGSTAPPFPDLVTRLEGIRLRASYPLPDGAKIFFDYYHEQYRTRDWMLDGVDVDTIFNILTLGELSPNYSVDTVGVWYRRPF